MGSSKSFRGGPSWADDTQETGRDSTKGHLDKSRKAYSQGGGVKVEGTIMSGDDGIARGNLKQARNQSKNYKTTMKQKTTFGQS